MKLVVIGAGSTYTPELIQALIDHAEAVTPQEVVLHDVDAERLALLTGMARRMMARAGLSLPLRVTTDRRDAVRDASLVLAQFRVGGNRARVVDETIPLRHGLLGHETIGAGGFSLALRTVPVLLDLANEIHDLAPKAWLLILTNPAGLLTEAVVRHTGVRALGLCNGFTYPRQLAAELLGLDPAALELDYIGLNHLAWAYRIRHQGVDRLPEVLARLPEDVQGMERAAIRALGLLPMFYARYFMHHDRYLAEQRAAGRVRAEAVVALEAELLRLYADPSIATVPVALARRGGDEGRGYGYADLAVAVMVAMAADNTARLILNTRSAGAVPEFDDDTVLELPARVGSGSVLPEGPVAVPEPVRDLVHAVKRHEQLTIAAALSGDRAQALLALASHPLVGEEARAAPMLQELLEAQRTWLPRFFCP